LATNGGNVLRWNDKSSSRVSAIINNNTNSYNTIYGTTPPTFETDTNSGKSVVKFGVGVITLTATTSETNVINVTNPSLTLSTGQHIYVTSNVGGLSLGSPYYILNPTGTPTTSFQVALVPASATPVTLTTTTAQSIPVVISSAALILPYGSHTVSIPINTTTSTLTVVYPPTTAAPVNYMLPSVGQTVNFTSTGVIGGINTGITYFITSVSGTVGTSLAFTVSTTPGGTNSSFTLGGTASTAGVSIGRGTFLPAQQDCTMFVVANTTHTDVVNSTAFSYGSYSSYGVRGMNLVRNFSQVGNGSGVIVGFLSGVQSNLNITSATFNNSIQSGWLNGSSFNTTNLLDLQRNGGNWQTGTVSAQVGAFMPAYPMFGQIAEILYYNSALSNTDRQTIEGYLAWKWGRQTSLPTIHPYYNQIRPFSRNFVPTDIDGCQFWIDPADRSVVTLTGSNVTAIRDKSGQGNDLLNAGSTLTYATTMNNLPTIVGPTGTNGNTITTTNTSIVRDIVNHSEFYVYRYSSTPSSATQTIQPQRVLFAGGQFLGMSLSGGTAITLVASSTTSPSTITLSTPANTNNLVINQPVQFTSTFGGITSGVTYFIFSKTLNAITISTISFGSVYTGITNSAGGSGTASTFSPYFEENNNIIGGGPVVSFFPPVMQNVSSYDIALRSNTYVVGLIRQNSVYTLTVNGAVLATGINHNLNFSPISYQIQVGNQGANIGDVIVYDAALNPTERQEVEGYLMWKWGLRGGSTTTNMIVPITHPFYNFPPPSSTPFQPEVQLYRKQFDPSDLSPVIWIDPKDNTTITKDATTSRVTSITNKGSYSGTFTNPTAGTGTGISGPLVTTATTGSGFRQQFLDFSNGGNYQVTNVVVGASPFTQLTLTLSPAHNGAIPVGAFVNFTLSAGSGAYPGGASSTLLVGPFQILTAIVSGGTTLTITTLSAHGIVNSQSIFLTINTGTFLGGADASGLTGAYTTAASGNSGSTIIIPITTSTNGIMAITDGHVRNNLGTTGPYITQSGTTGSNVVLTSYSPRASAGSLSPIGRIEYGQIQFTSALLTTTTSMTLRTPINHGLSSGNVVGISFNTAGTLPFQRPVPTTGTALNGASALFTSATVSGGTTLTITVTSNPFYISIASPNYVGLSPIRLTLLAGTTFTGGTSAVGISASSLVTQAGSNATTIVLTIALSPNGPLTFSGLPGILGSDTVTGSNGFQINETQTLSAGTTGNTIVVPIQSITQAITGQIVAQGTQFPTWNASIPLACLLYPLNGYAIEATSMTALNTNRVTIVWVSCLTNNYYRNSPSGSNGQPPVLAASVSLNGAGGADTTSGGRDYKIQTASFAGNAPRIGIGHNNAVSSFFFFNFTDSVTPFRVNSAVINLTATTVGDVGPNSSGAATFGMRYDNQLRNNSYSVLVGGKQTTTLTPSHLRIGGNTNATTNYTTHPLTGQWYEGGVGDIMIFNSILTLEQRQLVEGYLAQKYACQTYLGLTSVSLNTTASYNITSGSVSGSGPFTITLGGTFTTALANGSQITITGATPSGLNNTWTLTASSTTQIQFYSDVSYTWSSGGSIAGVTTTNANFIHPYRLNPITISPSLNLTQLYSQGLVAWFDAANPSTIGFSSDNLVNSWASSGGNISPLTLTQATSANQPTLDQNVQNGLPGIKFITGTISGSTYPNSSNLTTAASLNMNQFTTISSNSEYTNFAVVKFTINPATNQTVINIVSSNDRPYLLKGNLVECVAAVVQRIFYSPALTINVPYIITAFRRGLRGGVIVLGNSNRIIIETTFVNQRISGISTRLTIGGYSTTPSSNDDPFEGYIHEFAAFRYALTDQAIYQIEGYLAWKWGLNASLPTTHPYYKVRP
jgi:hypothetical protein